MNPFFATPIEVQIAHQCAPVLARLKPANILILKSRHTKEVFTSLKGTAAACRVLYLGAGKNLWLIYQPDLMVSLFENEDVLDFMKRCGYTDFRLQPLLARLQKRFTLYKQNKLEFPHEIGIFLGYPLCDVMGFIENEGQNYLYSGYWKVYGNVEEAVELFSRYEKTKAFFVSEIQRGKRLFEISDYTFI